MSKECESIKSDQPLKFGKKLKFKELLDELKGIWEEAEERISK